tara:strand:- start:2706 stop:8264 length:5559 start_codon:yes stop_codon:yes gene_type:complete
MACTDVQTIQAGNGSKTQFSFDFPYIFKSEIHVYFWNAATKEYDEKLTTDSTYPWRITDANPTIVEFTGTAPPSPTTPTDPGEPTVDNVKIRRITKVDDIRALFNPGSAIRSDDLNKNFEQLRYAVQESNCQGIPDDVDAYLKNYYWDNFDSTVYSTETWVSSDAKVATTAAMDARFQDESTETFTKAELASASNVIPDNDTAVPTTGAVKDYVDHVVETDVLVNSTGLEKSASNGQVTLGIAAGSVDLDRIKAADIITSSESNPNNDTTIATTAKIDDMIDAAITGDIAGSDGVSITNDGDGTITVGLSDGGVDLDKIKDADKITYAEQNAGSPSPADSNIFTASASARRFDTLVQTSIPSGTDWETGKTWLQNDDDQTLKIWNGSTWLDVASGGSFRTQDKVIYVDATGGDDSKTGHRISGPKLTIKDAINDINADISTSIKTAGSGYTNGSYTNVPITGGTTGSGLQANITVSGNAVTACTVTSTTTLEDYQIGDILSAADSNLGGGGGSGFELEVTGGGDGMTVIVSAGVYQEAAPIQIKRRNVSIIGMALRSCIVHPTVATQGDQSDGNHALFELNSGSFIQNLTLTGMKASNSGTNTLDSALPARQGWNFAFYNNCFLSKSPYIQNCTNFSDSEIDNSDLRAHRPRGGTAGDTDSAPTGGGMLADGAVPKSTSPLRSMVADSYTHVGLNGPGILVTNNGYTQCTSSYAFFNKYHIKCLNGGQANLAASTTDFGDEALVADGKSTTAIFTSTVDGAKADGSTTFNIDAPTAGSGWFGDAQRPASNMLVTVNSITYPVLSAAANGSGWTVTISRPNANKRSENLGLNGAIADGAAVSFFLRSMIASSGHTMEYVGSGTNYNALPENGGVPNAAKQIVESNDGKIWTAITDHNGRFAIGDFFTVDQRTGSIEFSGGSVAFDVVTDETPELGGQLDALNNKIVNLGTPTAAADAATKGYVDTTAAGILNVVEDTTPQLGGDLASNGNNINIADNDKVVVGTDGDLQIHHNNSNSIIGHDGTGNLYIQTTGSGEDIYLQAVDNVLIRPQGGEDGIKVIGNGSVELYYDNSKKFETGQYGVVITGSLSASNIDLDDDAKLLLGTGDDLQIYHDGSNSNIVDTGTGNLTLYSNGSGVDIKKLDGFENMARFLTDGAVELYHDSSKKLETTSSGIEVTGTVVATGGTYAAGDDTFNDAAIVIEEEGSIYTKDGTYLRNLIQKKSDFIQIGQQNTSLTDGIHLMPGGAGGGVKLHAGGTTNNVKLETTNTGVTVTGNIDVGDNSKLLLGTDDDFQIYHDGTSNIFLGNGSADFKIQDANHTSAIFDTSAEVQLYYDNSKKFETTSAGATVTGTLTINTPTADSHAATKAYVDSNAGGGGTLTATASGALTDGATVVVNSDGTVSVVSGSVTSTGLGTEAVFETGNTHDIAAVYCPDDDKVVVAYKDAGDSNKGKAVLGTISSGNITFGTPVEFDSGASGISITYDELANRVVLHYKDSANSDNMTIVVGNPSGSNITFGSPNTYYTASGGGNVTGIIYDPNAQRCFGCWANGTAETRGIAIKTSSDSVNISGTTQVVSGTGVWLSTAFDTSVNKIVIAYQDDDDSDKGHIIICTLTATDDNGSMSFGGETEFEAGTTTYIAAAYDANAEKTVIAYVDASDSNKGKALAVSVNSSSVVTKDTIGEFEAGSTANVSVAYNPDNQNVVILYRDSDDSNRLKSIEATVNGSSLDFGTAVQLTTDGGDQTSLCYSTADDVFVAGFRDLGNSNRGTGATLSMGSTTTNLTAENYIGISNGAYANGATATIQIVGSVDDAQSSLTPGQAYYVQLDGTLATTPATTSVFAGTAVAATKLIVKG